MTDWPALQRALWAAVRDREVRIGETAAEYSRAIRAAIRAAAGELSADAERYLADWIDAAESQIRAGIEAALAPYAEPAAASAAAQLGRGAIPALALAARSLRPEDLRSEWVRQRMVDAYDRRWPDGLRLSDRVWRWGEASRRAVSDAVATGVRTVRTTDGLVYDMQRAIEAARGQRYALESRAVADWADRLYRAGRPLAQAPGSMTEWIAAVREARTHIDGLRVGGTRRQAEAAFSAMRSAIEAGRADLLDRSVGWWLYDRQLYLLRRIARTEMATAGHRAVIGLGLGDPDVTGYVWRLTAGHPIPDICDDYAAVEYGLGRGVFPRDRVPGGKAHPHCMCSLTPTTRPHSGTEGTVSGAELVARNGRPIATYSDGMQAIG